MKFDNKQFESGVAQSMSTLDKLKEKLNFKGSTKSFEDISKAADKVSLDGLVKQTNNVGEQFNALSIIAISALNRITNEAITAGTKLVKSLSIDQVASGWSKYEARTAAVQTLVNATGKSVEQIEKYMDKLMLYSDETSYGFQDMTSALATMVSAGGDINKLVPLLEGFGNAVSFVGKGATEYSRAIIQLSQGYGRDALMLEDWKSIESTLGGAKQLKEVFIQVGEELNKIAKGEITIGTFNESLRNKWLDQQVMEQALGRFAEMTEKAFAMIEAGEAENVADAYAILSESVDDYRIKAAKAAQEAKSFTEAIDATKDAVSTKWMESFQIIFGNYAEATELWTELTNTLWDLFAASGDTRNEILNVWRAFEGREAMIDAAKAAFEALYTPVKAVGDAINEIFFPGTAAAKGLWLASATEAVRDFFKSLILSEAAATNLKKAFKLLLIPVYAFYQVLRVGMTIIVQTILLLFALADALLTLPSRLYLVENLLKRVLGEERYGRIVAALTTIVNKLGDAFVSIGQSVATIGKSIASAFSSKMAGSIERLVDLLAPIGGWILDRIVDGFEYLASLDYDKIVGWISFAINSLIDGFSIIINWCSVGVKAVIDFFSTFFTMSPIEMLRAIINAVKTMKDNLVEFAKSLGFDKLLDILSEAGYNLITIVVKLGQAIADFVGKLSPAKILIFAFGVSMIWLFMNLSKAISTFTSFATNVVEAIGAVKGVLEAFQKRLKGSPILQVAFAIGVLAVSLGALAQLDSNKLITAAIALGSLIGALVVLTAGMAVISKFLLTTNTMGSNLVKISKSLLAVAAAAAVLTAALYVLTQIKLEGIVGKIGALTAMITILGGAVFVLSKIMKDNVSAANSIFIIAFAVSLNLMVNALEKISKTSLSYSVDNIITIGVIVGLMIALGVTAKQIKLTSGVSMIMFAGMLLLFVNAIKPIASINMSEVIVALTYMIMIFTPLAIISKLVKMIDLKVGLEIASLAAGMLVMYFAIKAIGSLDLAAVAKGTLAIGAILGFIGLMNVISKIGTGFGLMKLEGSFLSLAAAILVLGVAINYIGGLEIGQVKQGTVVVSTLLILLTFLAKMIGTTKKATSTVIAISVCIGTLMAGLALLTLLDGQELLIATAALSAALISLGLVFKLIGEGLGVAKALTGIALIVSTLWAISEAFKLLANLKNVDKLVTIAESIGLVIVALGASFALVNLELTKNTRDTTKLDSTLGSMITMIALAGGVVAALSIIPGEAEGLITKAESVSIVLLSLATSMMMLGSKTIKVKSFKEIAGLLAEVSVLAGIITLLLANFTDTDDLVAKAAGFTIVVATLTGAIAALSLLASVIKSVDLATIGQIAVISVLAGVLGAASVGIMAWIDSLNIDDRTVAKIHTFVEVLLAMVAAIGILSIVSAGLIAIGRGGIAAIWGAIQAIAILALVGVAIYAVGHFLKDVEELEQIMDAAEYVIVKIGWIIGEFVGGAIGGLAVELVDGIGQALVNAAEYLSLFGSGIKDFVALDIPPSLVNSLGNLADAILKITSAEILDIIPTITGGGKSSLEQLGKELNKFAPEFVKFANEISGIDDEKVVAASECLLALGVVLSEIPTEGGLMGGIFGNKSLDTFGDGLKKIADGVNEYATSLNGSDVDDATIEKTNKLTQTLVNLGNELPKTGGLQKLLGETNFETFGQQLEDYGGSLKTYIGICNDIQGIFKKSAFMNAQYATDQMIILAKKIPESGLLTWVLGEEHNIGTFGSQLALLGAGIMTFFKCLSPTKETVKFGELEVEAGGVTIDEGIADAAKRAGETFAELAKTLPNTGGLVQYIVGQSNLATFGLQIGQYGAGISKFFTEITGVQLSKAKISLAEMMGNAFVRIANALDPSKVNDTWWDESAFLDFSQNLPALGAGIKLFYDNAKGIDWDKVTTAIDSIVRIVEISDEVSELKNDMSLKLTGALKDMSDIVVDGVSEKIKNGKGTVAAAITLMIDDAVSMADKILKSASPGSLDSLIDLMVSGLDNRQSDVTDRAGTVAQLAINKLTAEAYKLESVGELMIISLVTGFDAGKINLDTSVEEVFHSVIDIMIDVLEIRGADSQAFANIAHYCINGYVNGIKRNESAIYNKMGEIGNASLNKLRDTLAVKSPSKKFAEIGMYTMLGFAKGIDDNEFNAINAILKMGAHLLESIQEFYGINSPSTVMRDEVGRYIIQGIAEGIDEDMTAEEAAAKKAQNIISAFQSEFNKWSAEINFADLEQRLWSTINRNASEVEIREQEILTLEKKLTAQAERYNAAKAQYNAVSETGNEDAIRDARNTLMQEEITMRELTNELADLKNYLEQANWSLDINTADLENTLWKTMNRNATDEESKAQEEEYLNRKISYQAEIVAAAEDNYQKALELYGETADTTQEAYNTYIEAQTSLWELANSLSDLEQSRMDTSEFTEDSVKEMLDRYERALETLKQTGDGSDESIEEYIKIAKQYAGWDEVMNAREEYLSQKSEPIDPGEIVKNAMDNVQGVIELPITVNPDDIFREYLEKASGSIDGIGGNVQYITINMGNGSTTKTQTSGASSTLLPNSIAPDMTEELQQVMDEVSGGLDLEGLDFGNMLGGGIIDGIRNSLGGIGDSLIDVVTGGFGKLKDFIGFGDGSSGSGFADSLKGLGGSVMSLFGIGIEESGDKPVEAATDVSNQVADALSDLPNDMYDAGYQAGIGMANGLNDSSYLIRDAASSLGNAAYDETTDALQIKSPSRKYYYIGEMMIQGLADSLDDNMDVVRQAVENVLTDAQSSTYNNPIRASITPVIDDRTSRNSQALLYNSDGSITPSGYLLDSQIGWWTTEIMTAVQQLRETEEAKLASEQAAFEDYRATLDELRSTVQTLSKTPPTVNMTQNNYSPKALDNSTIYRNTKTALAKASIAASPSGATNKGN